jgi:serine/threonine protein phosphatase PrpC
VDYFSRPDTAERMAEFDSVLEQHGAENSPETLRTLNHFVYNTLGKAAFGVHKSLQEFANANSMTLKDLSTTLIFTLFKKYDAGYAFLSFGVGDCPIAVLSKDGAAVHMMNWIDVGEFSGGTRFITMPEIFQSEKFATRFGFKLIDDFSYLVMMSDGIYDPKFSVESALTDISKWKTFFADLGGQNEDGVKVDFNVDNNEIEQQLSAWMDFWSPGNHDDRTLAIVF